MSPENFVYWLQGLFELSGDKLKTLDEKQVTMIKEHLHYVFTKGVSPVQTKVPPEQSVNPPTPVPGTSTSQVAPWFTPEELERLRKEAEESRKRWLSLGGSYPGLGTVIC